jgi:hypothetical protein
LRFSGSLPKPERDEHEHRSDDGGHHVAQRDRVLVESGQRPEQAEDQPADQRAGKTDGQVAEEAETFALPGDEKAG